MDAEVNATSEVVKPKRKKQVTFVFVLDRRHRPLMPCTGKRARLLLERKRAVIHKLHPFTIRLKDRLLEDSELQDLSIKLDPGSKTTGIAIVEEKEVVDPSTGESKIVTVGKMLLELIHRGHQIKERMERRRTYRRSRRNRKTRYREPRFNNRTKPKGWLAPSLMHRVISTITQVTKLLRLLPITKIYQELVRFDMQQMNNPEISGIQYQQGTLAGYNVREYLLEKHNRQCVYCDAKDTILEIDHIHPRSKGGSNSVTNLTIACHQCNQLKGSKDIRDFVTDRVRLARILSQCKRPLKDAAAVNATRWRLFNELQKLGLPVSVFSGALTKYNRSQFNIPKDHCLDALCVGNIDSISNWNLPVISIGCIGRGSYKRTNLKPPKYIKVKQLKRNIKKKVKKGHLVKWTRQKMHFGFQSGDIAKAIVTKGKKIGIYIGNISVNAAGNFYINTGSKSLNGIPHRYFTLIQRGNGYSRSIKRNHLFNNKSLYEILRSNLISGLYPEINHSYKKISMMLSHCKSSIERSIVSLFFTKGTVEIAKLYPDLSIKEILDINKSVKNRVISRLEYVIKNY